MCRNSAKWDLRYLELAEQVSKWSKDPSSKIGAVIIGFNGQVLSQGYNGFPRNVDDSAQRLNDRPTKYKYVVHAEMNAIYNASFSGISLAGSTLYVHGLPVCSECAKGIIQVGILRVVMKEQAIPDNWKESCQFTHELFKEAGIEVVTVDPRHRGWDESSEDPWEPVKPDATKTERAVDATIRSSDILIHQHDLTTRQSAGSP